MSIKTVLLSSYILPRNRFQSISSSMTVKNYVRLVYQCTIQLSHQFYTTLSNCQLVAIPTSISTYRAMETRLIYYKKVEVTILCILIALIHVRCNRVKERSDLTSFAN